MTELRNLLFALGKPLGFDKSYEGNKLKQNKFIFSLDLATYNNFNNYQFLDVLDALSLRLIVKENYLIEKNE